ncbi:hypothetical protein X760_05250 [Mesorhizobium sp. LSHC422A00]|nr:hypothetical protein X760_05250 [Mesorhizobium sp. LSHC422A00]
MVRRTHTIRDRGKLIAQQVNSRDFEVLPQLSRSGQFALLGSIFVSRCLVSTTRLCADRIRQHKGEIHSDAAVFMEQVFSALPAATRPITAKVTGKLSHVRTGSRSFEELFQLVESTVARGPPVFRTRRLADRILLDKARFSATIFSLSTSANSVCLMRC